MFTVGQKVVCVETWQRIDGRGFGDEVGPVEGQIYTVRAIGYFNPDYADVLTVLLHEIINPTRQYRTVFHECPFGAFRFRPVAERKTDISIFKAMLTPQGVDA